MSEFEQRVEEDCFDTTAGEAEHLLVTFLESSTFLNKRWTVVYMHSKV